MEGGFLVFLGLAGELEPPLAQVIKRREAVSLTLGRVVVSGVPLGGQPGERLRCEVCLGLLWIATVVPVFPERWLKRSSGCAFSLHPDTGFDLGRKIPARRIIHIRQAAQGAQPKRQAVRLDQSQSSSASRQRAPYQSNCDSGYWSWPVS